MNGRSKAQERSSGGTGCVDPGALAVLTQPGLCSAVNSRIEAFAGCIEYVVHQCEAQRGHIAHAKAYEGSGVVRKGNSACCDMGAGASRDSHQNKTGHQSRYIAVCPDPVPPGLRSIKDRHQAMGISTRTGARERQPEIARSSDRGGPSEVASGSQGLQGPTPQAEKNKKGYPATGQCVRRLSRHGTTGGRKSGVNRPIVPPRDKIGCFWAFHCPATGHLFKEAICTGFLTGHKYGVKEAMAVGNSRLNHGRLAAKRGRDPPAFSSWPMKLESTTKKRIFKNGYAKTSQ